MRITKQIAQDVAMQLVSGKRVEIKELKNKQAEFLTEIYENSLSDLIKESFAKHKGFIYSGSSLRLSGVGLPQGYKNYPLTKELPKCNSCSIFPVTDEQAAIILGYSDKVDDLEREVNELQNNIEAALFNLRTYGNVEKEFPEAFKLLPVTKTNTGLMVNIKDIRCKLDKITC